MYYTGNKRANQFQDACMLAVQQGFKIDASLTKPMLTPSGRYTSGWCEYKTKTIWIYVSPTISDKGLHKMMLHEVGHARYYMRAGAESWWRTIRKMTDQSRFDDREVSEDHAEVHAWGRLTAAQRDGIGWTFYNGFPTSAQAYAVIK